MEDSLRFAKMNDPESQLLQIQNDVDETYYDRQEEA